jgi:hypothetical protein
MHLNTTPAADTFDQAEYNALCEVVAATHLGGDYRPTVQAAVTGALITREQLWLSEASEFLARFNGCPASAPMYVA